MNDCRSMRDHMLEAELSELRGEGTTLTASHIRECPSCRQIGRMLVDDTAALAHFVAVRPVRAARRASFIAGLGRLHRSRWWPEPTAVALALPMVAAIAAALLWHPGRPGASGSGPALTPILSGAGAVPRASAPPEVEPPSSAAGESDGPRSPGDDRSLAQASVPRQPSAIVGSASAEQNPGAREVLQRWDAYVPPRPPPLEQGVRLVPASGSRALMMRTRDPAVTVVWIY